MTLEWVPTGVQFLVGTAAALTAATVIYRKVLRPAWHAIVQAVRMWPSIADDIATLKALADDTQDIVNRQLRPNGGSSMWDTLKRVEQQGADAAYKVEVATERVEALAMQKEHEHRQLREGQERQWQAFLWLARHIPTEDDSDVALGELDDEA